MGWPRAHPETGQLEPPSDVAYLHLLVSSTGVARRRGNEHSCCKSNFVFLICNSGVGI